MNAAIAFCKLWKGNPLSSMRSFLTSIHGWGYVAGPDRIRPMSQKGQALIEYLLLMSLFTILLAAAFVKFQGLLPGWFNNFVNGAKGPTI